MSIREWWGRFRFQEVFALVGVLVCIGALLYGGWWTYDHLKFAADGHSVAVWLTQPADPKDPNSLTRERVINSLFQQQVQQQKGLAK